MKAPTLLQALRVSPIKDPEENLEDEVENLHARYDGEAREESQRACTLQPDVPRYHELPLTSHSGQHVLKLGPLVLSDPVEGGRVEVDPHHLQAGRVTELFNRMAIIKGADSLISTFQIYWKLHRFLKQVFVSTVLIHQVF